MMEQVQYNLLFRWFIGLSMDDALWVPTVFSKNRERLIEHAAVIEFLNQTVELAQQKALLSNEHFSVDGPLTLTVGADKGYDAQEFIEALTLMKVTPHVAQNTSGTKSALPDETAQTLGYVLSQQKRKLIEQGFGWAKTVGNMAQLMVRGLAKVDQQFMLNLAGCNLVRMRSLGQIRPEAANG